MIRRLIPAILMASFITSQPLAQSVPPEATLIADQIDFSEGATQLVASGNVEVFYKNQRLEAEQIRYDRTKNRVDIIGPLILMEGDTRQLFADQAQLSLDLQEGILRSARFVLDQQLEITAENITRENSGQNTIMEYAVASTCKVCETNEVPLWQIRARRVVHDQDTRQLIFEHAQLRIAGLPVAYLPRLRLPDPTVDRLSGFLVPSVIGDSTLGFGVKIPYFFTLGPHRDLTLTPFVTDNKSYTLEARYRQAFTSGDLSFEGAISEDQIEPGLRFYVFAEGAFELSRGYDLTFNLDVTSDNEYLRQYGYSDKDRLQSRLALTRVDRDHLRQSELVAFQSLRDSDDNADLPNYMISLSETRRFTPRLMGGQGYWTLELHGHARENDDPNLTMPDDIRARDVARLTGSVDWGRNWVWQSGITTRLSGAIYAAHYEIAQDPVNYPSGTASYVVPYLGLETSLPLARNGRDGVRHVIEPRVQVVLAPNDDIDAPNEDAIFTEFDPGNLFSFNRFTGRDALEMGNRLNIGLTYTRLEESGREYGLGLGRTLRAEDLGQFNPSTGLDGRLSDWMISAYYRSQNGAMIDMSSLVDNDFTVTRAEVRALLVRKRQNIATGLTWLRADEESGRPNNTKEWRLDSAFDITSDWTAELDWRYDLEAQQASEASLGVIYRSDCVDVGFTVERRFTETSTLKPTTTFGLSVAFSGFGADNRTRRRGTKTCMTPS